MSEFVMTVDGEEVYHHSGEEGPIEAALFFEDDSIVRVQKWLRFGNDGKVAGDNWAILELRPVSERDKDFPRPVVNSDTGSENSDSGGVIDEIKAADELARAVGDLLRAFAYDEQSPCGWLPGETEKIGVSNALRDYLTVRGQDGARGVTEQELATAFKGIANYHMGKDVPPEPETMRKVWDES